MIFSDDRMRPLFLTATLVALSSFPFASISLAQEAAARHTPGPRAGQPSDSLAEAVVYTTLRPHDWDIYLFEQPGSAPRRLTDDPALDYGAVFSPDGRWVVFTSERTGSADLYALDLKAGGAPIRLTRHHAMDDAAAFSPDGRQLAFVSTRDGYADIFLMPFTPGDTTAESRAINLTRRRGGDFRPAFSPDGQRIAFSRQDDLSLDADPGAGVLGPYTADLYVMDVDGANVRRLSEPGALSGSPAWSADGETIYYHRADLRSAEIRRIGADGQGDSRVVANGLSPAVGADGRITFWRPSRPFETSPPLIPLRSGHIYSVTTNGSDLRLESDTLRSYFGPAIDPGTGRMLAHGPGDGGDLTTVRGGTAFFAPPDARRRVELPDRTIEVRGIRGWFPAITPDGEIVSTPLHLTEATLPLEISLVDGGGKRDLHTPAAGYAWGAAIAREAGTVVFAVGPSFAPEDARVDIWKVQLDGSGAVNLTPDSPANDALPHISADGSRVAFRSGRDGNKEIYAMNADGGDLRRLTDTPGVETMPTLSPDGEWVVYPTDRAGSMKLYLQRLDGSEGRFLEPDRLDVPEFAMHPRFSQDGEWIVFTSSRSWFNDEWPLTLYPQPYGELWAVPVAGGPAVRLTHSKWEDGPNDWGFVRLPHETGQDIATRNQQ